MAYEAPHQKVRWLPKLLDSIMVTHSHRPEVDQAIIESEDGPSRLKKAIDYVFEQASENDKERKAFLAAWDLAKKDFENHMQRNEQDRRQIEIRKYKLLTAWTKIGNPWGLPQNVIPQPPYLDVNAAMNDDEDTDYPNTINHEGTDTRQQRWQREYDRVSGE